jgi:AAA domain
MGQWLTTTSRVVLNADTGLGKSMLVIGLGMSGAAGSSFLHWAGVRPAKVLYIDGEMSRRLLKQRLADEERRLGASPQGFHALSHEDIAGFAPLNTKAGQKIIERKIARIGSVDLIIFDNIMSLISGSMSDEESWAQTMPWIRSLTARGIGQLWVHHTGHNKSRGFGTSTREWQMDTVIHLDRIERADTDVSFQLKFSKARERTPTTRRDFTEAKIALVNDEWTWRPAEGKGLEKISPENHKFLDALRSAVKNSPNCENAGFPHIALEAWKNECVRWGLIDLDKKDTARALFSRNKLKLIAANYVSCTDTTVQLLV